MEAEAQQLGSVGKRLLDAACCQYIAKTINVNGNMTQAEDVVHGCAATKNRRVTFPCTLILFGALSEAGYEIIMSYGTGKLTGNNDESLVSGVKLKTIFDALMCRLLSLMFSGPSGGDDLLILVLFVFL